ncbi:MAG: uncharacterized protein JWN04_2636 [Myxococcaceae bacterium]|nr:uncharacterized protein [Myxococcaceae bacterium]
MRGTARPDSDLDVAILPVDPELSLADELALQACISSTVKREVDLVRLDRCTGTLRFRVAREGLLVFAEPGALSSFRARAGIEHAELAPLMKRASELFLKRGSALPQSGPMTDAEVVIRKLAVLREHALRARRRRPASVDALAADLDLQDALCMSLLVAIQEAIDIAFHVSADEGSGVPSSNVEAFEIIARNGVLSIELAQSMGRAAALRNRIAHGHASVDLAACGPRSRSGSTRSISTPQKSPSSSNSLTRCPAGVTCSCAP